MKLKGKKIKKNIQSKKKLRDRLKKITEREKWEKKKGLTSLLSLFILTYEIERKKIGKKYSIKTRKNLKDRMMTPTFSKKYENFKI